MTRDIKETYTSDITHNLKLISLDDLEYEISEEEVVEPSTSPYTTEDLELIWRTLRNCYDINDDHYIIMYLIYYLGFSYRKTGAVVGRVPSLVFLYEDQALHAVRVFLGIDIIVHTDPRDFISRVKSFLNIDYIAFPPFTDKDGKLITFNPPADAKVICTPEEIQERFLTLQQHEEPEAE